MSSSRVDEGRETERSDNLSVRYLSVRIPDELFEAVKNAADRDRRTMTAWVTIALERHLAEQGAREQRPSGE